MYEYYYNLFDKVYGNGGPGDGDPVEGSNEMGGMSNGEGTVDDHSFMGEKSDKWDKMIDKLQEGLSDEEKESLKQTIQKHFTPPKENPDKQAGVGTGGQWVFAAVTKVKKKKKWETIIKKWAAKYLVDNFKENEQWARLNRRMAMLPKDMFLPTDMEIDETEEEKRRIKVYFFLDTSGSCWNLKDRFFAAAESLPDKRFDIRLFCFDTTVQETTLASRKIYGGGGTSFRIMEEAIQKEIKKGEKYPDGVFVITDGYGDKVNPAEPKRWYWFLTGYNTRSYIPQDSAVFNLEDFE
jgi:predicted metal-dependent peptidase